MHSMSNCVYSTFKAVCAIIVHRVTTVSMTMGGTVCLSGKCFFLVGLEVPSILLPCVLNRYFGFIRPLEMARPRHRYTECPAGPLHPHEDLLNPSVCIDIPLYIYTVQVPIRPVRGCVHLYSPVHREGEAQAPLLAVPVSQCGPYVGRMFGRMLHVSWTYVAEEKLAHSKRRCRLV
jgi:hypothetical protein